MEKRVPTTERLAQALEKAGAPGFIVGRARAGYYDDFKSPLMDPIRSLVIDAKKFNLTDIERRAKEGEFDAPKWESDAWARSPEGMQAVRDFTKGNQ